MKFIKKKKLCYQKFLTFMYLLNNQINFKKKGKKKRCYDIIARHDIHMTYICSTEIGPGNLGSARPGFILGLSRKAH